MNWNSLKQAGKYQTKKVKKKMKKTNPLSTIKLDSQKAIDKAKKMQQIEQYAKDNGVSITQAMIHFM